MTTATNRGSDPLRRSGGYAIGDSSRKTKTKSLLESNNNNSEQDDSGFDCGEDFSLLDCNDNDACATETTTTTRKPSYVGLSCAVSGYSSYARYESGKTAGASSPPSQIQVGSEPQTLDAVMRSRSPPPIRRGQEFLPVQREGSPGSDCSGSSSIGSSGSAGNGGGGGGGSLVQKQIERLYGGRVLPLRVTSPEPKKERPTKQNPMLDFKPLKIPAVFRLLRPEFREQLKNNSCTVNIPIELQSSSSLCYRVTTSNFEREKKERMIPIKKASERIIPVVVEKPALPAKPKQPSSPTSNTTTTHVVTSPALVAKAVEEKKVVKPIPEPEVEEDQPDFSRHHGGIRERALLCPILEEDAESNASTSSLIAAKKRLPTEATAVASSSQNGQVQDGHYFIKALENETFKFEEQICDFEEDLSAASSSEIPDDVRDSILAAVGKAKLLMGQKLVQFRGLCDRNINSSQAEDPFVPTLDDLAGFWDMVYIQIEHVHSLFAELVALRKNGWVQPSTTVNGTSSSKMKSNAKSSPMKKRFLKPSKENSDAQAKEKSEATKARDEARKKMIEERRKLMKQQKDAAAVANDGVEMFVAVK